MRIIAKKVQQWAKNRELLKQNGVKQTLKTVSQIGKLSESVLSEDDEQIKKSIGDVQICLMILCEQKGYDYDECLSTAFENIEGVEGETKGGVFFRK